MSETLKERDELARIVRPVCITALVAALASIAWWRASENMQESGVEMTATFDAHKRELVQATRDLSDLVDVHTDDGEQDDGPILGAIAKINKEVRAMQASSSALVDLQGGSSLLAQSSQEIIGAALQFERAKPELDPRHHEAVDGWKKDLVKP